MKRKHLIFSVAVMLFGCIILAACSSDDDKNNGGHDGHPNQKANVAILYYAIGGGDLDNDTESDFARAAYQMTQASGSNVRYFVQYKYSSQEGYQKNFDKNKKGDANWNYHMSGKYGQVYRYELAWDMVNPQIFDNDGNINLNTGQLAFPGLATAHPFAGADFRMFDPQNVADFIRTCMQQAPNVEYYALVFGDHGGGFSVTSDYDKSTPAASAAMRGVMYDDNFGEDQPCLTPQELAQALNMLTAAERAKIKLVYYDCCLMNTLEVLGELHGLVPYALSSSHSVTAGNQALFVEAMAKVPTQGVATAISKFCGDLLEYQRKNYLYLKNNGYNTDGNEHYDYNLTDISKLDAAFAALKKVTDFLVKQDVSKVDAYIKAACSCYQFYNKEPFYDVVSYLKALKTNVFPNNVEYAALLQEAETAIRAAIAGHADYSYELDPTGKSVGLTFSVTLGFDANSVNMMYNGSKYLYNEADGRASIMSTMGGGQGITGNPYFNHIVVDNGDVWTYTWMDKNYKPDFSEDFKWVSNSSWLAWADYYKKTYFDQKTGWSRWFAKNPGVPCGNPPLNDENDYVRDIDYRK